LFVGDKGTRAGSRKDAEKTHFGQGLRLSKFN